MKYFCGMAASGVITIVGSIWAHYLLIFALAGFAYFMWMGVREDNKQRDAAHETIAEADAHLRKELLETHFSLKVAVGLEENLQRDILKLLIEAAKHLVDPHIDDDVFYNLEYFLKRNKIGLQLVAQAKALLPPKPGVKMAMTSADNASSGYLS